MLLTDKLNEVTKSVKDAAETYEKVLSEAVSNNLQNVFLELFKEYPDVLSIKWDAYTPYFNDGDICTFGIHSQFFTLREGSRLQKELNPDNNIYLERWSMSTENLSEKSTQFKQIAKQLDTFLHSIKDGLLIAFGDHVTVMVTKEGITTSECEHD